MQQVGEKIKKYRTLRNLSQQQLANKCGLSKNAIWNYENNQRTPTIESLYKIADSLEIGINELTNNIKKQDDDNKVIKNVKHLCLFLILIVLNQKEDMALVVKIAFPLHIMMVF